MNLEEQIFVEEAYIAAREENDVEGGLLFPLLVTKKWSVNRIIRARVTPSRKNTTACYACFGYKKNFNGVFFPLSPEIDDEFKELIEVQYFRIPAIISLIKEGDNWRIQTNPKPEALEAFFEEHEAVYIVKKEELLDDNELPF